MSTLELGHFTRYIFCNGTLQAHRTDLSTFDKDYGGPFTHPPCCGYGFGKVHGTLLCVCAARSLRFLSTRRWLSKIQCVCSLLPNCGGDGLSQDLSSALFVLPGYWGIPFIQSLAHCLRSILGDGNRIEVSFVGICNFFFVQSSVCIQTSASHSLHAPLFCPTECWSDA